MQIKTRLTLLFTGLVAALLLAFAMVIYITSAETREDEYFRRLKQQAETKANLLLDTKVSSNVLQLIYKKAPNALFQEEVAIYDPNFHLIYHDAVENDKVKETRGMIDTILAKKEIQFYIQDVQVVGFLFEHNHKQYIITAASKDEYGLTKLNNLRNTLIISFFIAVICIFFVGRFLAQQSLKPVSNLVEKVKKITATNLDLRVPEGNRKDEIAALAITFNEMLNRLEKSFDAQKQFVSNISHELRTPLTAMLTEMQLSSQKERDTQEYQQVIEHIIQDTQKLIRLTNSLLNLAKANYDQTEISFKEIRIDEVLLDARQDILHNHPDYNVQITFDREFENDDFISVNGNEYLLRVAFANLIENGCKFSSNHQVQISISYQDENVLINFTDQGIGMDEQSMEDIFTPFFRGKNSPFAEGHGIGLSLTQKIITLHQGNITVSSKENQGTTFQIVLPHI
ncbi:MAG TPA: HAMP domain-containing sensor histidine kinase [Daejeonella sp.]|nr:HAMP domain-containing sensor histidine kinase [Daejeonella sp.]